MFLDQTRFDAFWKNPEHYRIVYECNLVPRKPAYGLARGTAFHLISEMQAGGWSKDAINKVLTGEIDGPRGRIEAIEPKAIANAWVLIDALNAHPSSMECQLIPEGCEREFVYQIPGSPHSIIGRIDQILTRKDQLWVSELKTAYVKAQYQRFMDEWSHRAQASFVMIGAKAIGYDTGIDDNIAGQVYVRQVVEGTPPRIWELEVKRSRHQLQVMILNVHQTCEIITMLRKTFGIENPWPHIQFNWPCSVPGKCEMESLETRNIKTFTAGDLEQFKSRDEHLSIVKDLLKSEV